MGLGMKVLAMKNRFVPANIAREMLARLKMASSRKPSRAAFCTFQETLVCSVNYNYWQTGLLNYDRQSLTMQILSEL